MSEEFPGTAELPLNSVPVPCVKPSASSPRRLPVRSCQWVVIYEALCFDLAQGRKNGPLNETRTHSSRFATLPEVLRRCQWVTWVGLMSLILAPWMQGDWGIQESERACLVKFRTSVWMLLRPNRPNGSAWLGRQVSSGSAREGDVDVARQLALLPE